MDAFRKFFAFTKADDGTRTVEGLMTAELPDKSDEIFDYESSLPYVKAWSSEAAKGTGESSLGNVREMHSLIAAGKLTQINFDDARKAITVKAKIVDDSTWRKIEERVLRGFSIGGSYVKKWQDGDYTRFTADISEVSVVDNPALREAVFDFPSGAMPVKCDFVFAKADGSGHAANFARGLEALSKGDVDRIAKGVAEALEKKGKEPYGDVEYADPGYQSDKKKRYPLDTEAHVRAAWSYINMPKNSRKYSAEHLAHIKGKIRAAMRRYGIEESDDKKKKAAELETAINFILAEPAKKGMYQVGQLAAVMETVTWVTQALQYEREAEGDDSKVPTDLAALLEEMVPIFLDLCEEETNELAAQLRAMEGKSMTPEELAKKADTLKELHGHLKKAHAHHEKMVEHHEKMAAMHKAHGEMHEAQGEHLKNALECCKAMMDQKDDGAQPKEKDKDAGKTAAMTNEDIQAAIADGIAKALAAAQDPTHKLHLVPRDPAAGAGPAPRVAPGDGELSRDAVGF